MASMAEMLQTAMTQAELTRKSNPLANNIMSALGGMEKGYNQRLEREEKAPDRELKMLEIIEKKIKMEREKAEWENRVKEYDEFRKQYWGEIGAEDLGAMGVVGKNGQINNSPSGKINKFIDDRMTRSMSMQDGKVKYEIEPTRKLDTGASTSKKEFTDFKKAESLRKQAKEGRENYYRNLPFMDEEKRKQAQKDEMMYQEMVRRANVLQGIVVPEDSWLEDTTPVTDKKGGGFGKIFGTLWNNIKLKFSGLPPEIRDNVKKLKNAGAKPEEIKKYIKDEGY
ncbi:MAG: hypothetical protein WC373_00895 [Smithella sp.]|jgi:hypothetical protein